MQGFNMTVFNLIEKRKRKPAFLCIQRVCPKTLWKARLKIVRKKHGFDGSEAEMEVSAAVSTENR